MKNSIGRMRNARINAALKNAFTAYKELEQLQGFEHLEKIENEADRWQKIRDCVTELDQCFHEANAYNNAMSKN